MSILISLRIRPSISRLLMCLISILRVLRIIIIRIIILMFLRIGAVY